MAEHYETVDVTESPELRNIAEEVRSTRRPRLLRQGDKDLALVIPFGSSQEHPAKEGIEAALSASGSWKGLVDPENLKAQIRAERGSTRIAPSL